MNSISTHPGFDLPPLAEATGPFATAEFAAVVCDYDDGDPWVVASESAFLPLRRLGDDLVFIGDPDVTDYHTPHGDGCEHLITVLAADAAVGRFLLDSLPEEAAKPLAAGLNQAGWRVRTRVHEVCAVVHLPETFDDYLGAVGKKERHEIRRKRRRYERLVGEVRHETHVGDGEVLDDFVRLHRMAEGDKRTFMTPERHRFFASLAELDGWRFDVLRTPSGAPSAVVFGYSDPSGYYLYNSAYDPACSQASPGMVLLAVMIEAAVAEGKPRFDFLKGGESYKFRLGARPRPLIEIEGRPGGES